MEKNSSLKRVREEVKETQEELFKRQKSYKDIITLLEEAEDEPSEDFSSLFSTLLGEISLSGSEPVCAGSDDLNLVQSGLTETGSGGEEEEVEKVMKHLLEASDDELGIPKTTGGDGKEMDGYDGVSEGHMDGGDLLLPLGEGWWEFEDHEANNYYNLLQSDIFM